MADDGRKQGTVQPIGGGELERLLERLVAMSRSEDGGAGVLIVRMDGADSVSQRWGEAAAAAVRRWAASRIASVLRHGDVLVRHGEDGFAVLCRATSAEQALGLAYRIRTRISQHPCDIREAGDAYFFTLSIGVAHMKSADESDARDLLTAATRAAGIATAAGGDCVREAE